ncbi:ABC transporter permease [Pediococcus ethanolidurans]|uniref:ABC-type nitrate sulfonate bicarbonate transport system, permease component n=1 Tax=Pediococcus ethanolidurans TaxID=319653 RepID=A0A0R2K020_9LACO|nr:ABC transporter permease [Pediococcus ethanolidurans]KRN82699.1 ABC-type nitrate sulfonate bicarbonate transport system, permease component [Pediococcus ethanolidurans]GEN94938.1 nitrate ABC transporter permease [Pediococcus ethanolidurans]SER47708.1 ABC-type nitrate/sulfonate/bicarbonate transport system, permease component [Pediococcus ethanolidurans]
MKKRTSININFLPVLVIVILLIIWQLVSYFQIVPTFMLPSPINVVKAFIADFPLLMSNAGVTLLEAFWGLLLGVIGGVLIAVIMDLFEPLYKAIYPLLVISQTVPAVAIAPLLILWFGYGMLPKIVLITITTFFPVAVEMLTGFRATDRDLLHLMKTMGATKWKLYYYVKFPNSLNHFFSSLKISVSYAIVSAVISEWVGGFSGLGVYMTRVMKAYAYDKMFAVIFLISAMSLLLIWLVTLIQHKVMPWEAVKK